MSYDVTTDGGRKNMTAGIYQESDNVRILTAQLNQNFRLGLLNWENIVTYQNSSNKSVLPLPDWNIFSNLYLKFRIAKVLGVELGADATYFSKYYAPDFCPGLNQFAVQKNEASKVELGGYPFVDVYANMTLKGVRFFLMMSNVINGGGIQLPMTTDVGASKLFLQNINTNMIERQGTAIGAAISKCMRSFSGNDKVAKTIIIISDGENHEDDAVGMAQQAREKGIIIHTVGMGTTNGVPIPIKNSYGQTSFMMDRNGSPVTTKLNEQMLQEIAAAGGGVYSREDFSPILKALDDLEKTDFESQEFNVYNERFQVFLLLGLVCLLLDFCILDRKNKWLKNIDVFKIKM